MSNRTNPNTGYRHRMPEPTRPNELEEIAPAIEQVIRSQHPGCHISKMESPSGLEGPNRIVFEVFPAAMSFPRRDPFAFEIKGPLLPTKDD